MSKSWFSTASNKKSPFRWLLAGLGLGVAGTYLLDAERGAERRMRIRDNLVGFGTDFVEGVRSAKLAAEAARRDEQKVDANTEDRVHTKGENIETASAGDASLIDPSNAEDELVAAESSDDGTGLV